MDDTRVLVAVRNPLAGEAVQSILELGGFEVVDRVSLAQEVAPRAAALTPNLVILDWQILKVDAEVVGRLRQAVPDAKLIVLSEDEYTARATHREGVTAFISKDASAETLLATISRIAASNGKTVPIMPPALSQIVEVPIASDRALPTKGRGLADTITSVLAIAAVLMLNFWLVYPLFLGGYTRFMGSIEAAFITDARFIFENGLFASWNRLWYLGFPFHLFYTPLLPYLSALVHSSSPAENLASSYRVISAAFYVAGPATFFLFVRYLTGRNLTATICAVGYSILPSVVYLMPSLYGDAAEFGFAPWQLVVMVKYGEGPHIAALTVAPLAALLFLRALRHGGLANYLLAAVAIGLLALINWIGLFALAVILAVVLLSEALISPALTTLVRGVWCALIAFGLVAFWYNVSFVKASLAFGSGGGMLDDAPKLLIVLIVIAYALAVLLSKKPSRQAEVVIGLWFAAFAIIVVTGQYLGIRLAPQPIRYTPELSMGAVMALGLAITRFYDRAGRLRGLKGLAGRTVIVLIVAVAFLALGQGFAAKGRLPLQPNESFAASSEQQVARWLAENGEGDAAYLTGSHAFWLNVEADVPQLRGGTDQGATNPWWAHVSYQVNTGPDGDLAVSWLRALGVRWVVVSYPDSTDVYKDYAFPEKFENDLPRKYMERGTAIFEVTSAKHGLAVLVDEDRAKMLKPIRNVSDALGLADYLSVVNAQPAGSVSYAWAAAGRLEIEASPEADSSALLVRMTSDDGWRARVDGQPAPIEVDPMSFLRIPLAGAGQHHVILERGRTMDEYAGYAVTAITILLLIWCGVRRLRASGAGDGGEHGNAPETQTETGRATL